MNILVKENELRAFTENVFRSAGVQPHDAQIATDVMIEANLCGVDSHGVRMLPGYVTLIRNKKINPSGRIEVLKESSVFAHLDANLALGSVVGVRVMQMAVEKAKTSALGFCLVRNSSHWDRPAYYTALAARQGCVGMCFANTEANMPPYGAREPRVGNNPLSIGAPRASGEPVVLDMAMSQAAWGKIVMYQRQGRKVPAGWGFDDLGQLTDDPADIIRSQLIMPMGQHKGTGLSIMIDILTGILAGGKFCGELVAEGEGQPWATAYSQFFIAIDIAAFIAPDEFRKKVDEFVAYVKAAPRTEGYDEILIPGERAWQEKTRRKNEGIPLDEVTFSELKTLAEELGIPLAVED